VSEVASDADVEKGKPGEHRPLALWQAILCACTIALTVFCKQLTPFEYKGMDYVRKAEVANGVKSCDSWSIAFKFGEALLRQKDGKACTTAIPASVRVVSRRCQR